MPGAVVNALLRWCDVRMKGAALLWMATLTTWALAWAMRFAEASSLPGLERAAVVAAVLAPVSALNGYVFKWYTDSRATVSSAAGAPGQNTS
jgi:hypothetical protein